MIKLTIIFWIIFSLLITACEENIKELCDECIYYDIEQNNDENIIENGDNKEITSFSLYTSGRDEVYLHNLIINITALANNKEEEIDFYNAFTDFYLVIDETEINPSQATATNIVFTIVNPQPIIKLWEEEALNIQIRARNINATLPKVSGFININVIKFRDQAEFSLEESSFFENIWDVSLGKTETLQTPNGTNLNIDTAKSIFVEIINEGLE